MNTQQTSQNVTVIGAGAFGCALTAMALRAGHNVQLLTHTPEKIPALKQDKYLEQATIKEHVPGSHSGIEGDFLILAVPTQALREVCKKVTADLPTQPTRPFSILSASKGIENETLALPQDILEETFGKKHLLGTLSGPSFAKELKAGLPTNVVVASDRHQLCQSVRDNFHQKTFRVYESNDVIGVEVAGALKNVVAMVAGAVDGLEMGMNGRAAVVTRGFGEIAKIGVKMGAKPVTFLGLSGLGDLMLTCTGSLSRNRTFGYRLAKGENPEDIMNSMGQVVEGVFTVQSAFNLARKLDVEAPIIKTAYEVIQGSLTIENAIGVLMSRESKFEFDWSLSQ